MKEIKLLLFAILVTIIVLPLGLLFNIYNSIKEMFHFRIWSGIKHFVKYWVFALKQTYVVFKYLIYHIATSLDYSWNSTSGELFEEVFATEEDTMYGKGKYTISTATGYCVKKGILTKAGKWFSSLLNKFFNEKQHCLDSYKRHLANEKHKIKWNY